jgi:4'-phosphopantetheinyl transferase
MLEMITVTFKENDKYNSDKLTTQTHIWIYKNNNQDEINQYYDTLNKNEIIKLNNFYNKKEKIEYLFSRGIQKTILSRYLNIYPKNVNFKYIKGKPFLINSINKKQIQFSKSNSNELSILGITKGYIGIDIEYIKRKIDHKKISNKFFPETNKTINLSEDEERLQFYEKWTEMEALKKLGTPIDFKEYKKYKFILEEKYLGTIISPNTNPIFYKYN